MKFLQFLFLAVLLIPLAALSQDSAQLVDVIAVGVGLTQDEAMKAANKAAVEQVVGTMVDASTLVENDELVEDRILTYSAGLIADSKIIGTPKKDANGLVTLKVKATVRKTALREKLVAAKLVSVELDGQSLWAQAVSAQDNLADAEAMIKDVLAKHLACVVAEPVAGKNGKSPLDYDPRTGEVFANVRVRIDMAKYSQFVKEVVNKLGPMAVNKIAYQGHTYDSGHRFIYFKPPTFQGRLLDTENVLLVVQNLRSFQTIALVFDRNRFQPIEQTCGEIVTLQVSLLDSGGNSMSTMTRRLPEEGVQRLSILCATGYGARPRCAGEPCAILPAFGDIDYDGQFDRRESWMDRTFRISLGTFAAEELKTAGKLEIKVGHMKDGQFIE